MKLSLRVIERVYPSRLGRYFVSSLVEKLYVTAMNPATAQPIAPAGVGARATPARVRKLAPILIGFGSAANTEDMDSDSRSASTIFFMTSSFLKVYATARSVFPNRSSKEAHRRPGRPSGARSIRNGGLPYAAYAAAYPWSKIGNGGAVRPGRTAARTGPGDARSGRGGDATRERAADPPPQHGRPAPRVVR